MQSYLVGSMLLVLLELETKKVMKNLSPLMEQILVLYI